MQESTSIRQRPLGELIADDLRARIIGGALPRGTHLVEGSLAEHYDVSRAPVREALQRLAVERLVKEGRRRGIFVIGLTAKDIDELYSLRLSLEQLAFERATKAAEGEASWEAARTAIAHMREADRRKDTNLFGAADLEFHRSFYPIANHGRLQSVWEQYEPTFKVLFSNTIRPVSRLQDSVRDHERLLDFAVSGDVEGGQNELEIHLSRAQAAMLQVLGLTE